MSVWGVCYCEARGERKAVAGLGRQGYETWLPVMENGGVLFPRYLFVDVGDGWRGVSGTRGVVSLLMAGDRPGIVGDETIRELRVWERDGIIKLGKLERWRLGQRVQVQEGLFEGAWGLYDGMSGRERVKVLLELLGRKVRVELSEDVLR